MTDIVMYGSTLQLQVSVVSVWFKVLHTQTHTQLYI